MRAIIAARKSNKVDSETGEGIGLDTQDEKSRAFCERLGIEVAGVARDTITGRVAPIDRPDLGHWLSERIQDFDAIVAYKADRYSRGEDTDWSRIETWAADHGKTLILVDSASGIRYPARDDSDRWQWMAQKTQAGKEWNDIRERSTRAQCRILRDGSWVGRAPWGYKIAGTKYNKVLVIDPELERYVIEIFARAVRGESLRAIARWLESEGVPTERGNSAWSEVAARQIIVNPTYTGTAERRCAECGQTHKTTVPAIIDPATQERAKASMASRVRGKVQGGGRPSGDPAMLAPVCVHCSDLDSENPRIVRMYRSGTNGELYYCKTRTQDGVHAGCKRTARVAEVDATADEWLSMLDRPEMVRTVTYPAAELENKLALAKRAQDAAYAADDIDAMMAARETVKAIDTELKNTPREAIEQKPTGRTLGQAWQATPAGDRKDWLRKQRIMIAIEDGRTQVLMHEAV
jgi:DNA invertase Pin-like site-specific DNA recombinase